MFTHTWKLTIFDPKALPQKIWIQVKEKATGGDLLSGPTSGYVGMLVIGKKEISFPLEKVQLPPHQLQKISTMKFITC